MLIMYLSGVLTCFLLVSVVEKAVKPSDNLTRLLNKRLGIPQNEERK